MVGTLRFAHPTRLSSRGRGNVPVVLTPARAKATGGGVGHVGPGREGYGCALCQMRFRASSNVAQHPIVPSTEVSGSFETTERGVGFVGELQRDVPKSFRSRAAPVPSRQALRISFEAGFASAISRAWGRRVCLTPRRLCPTDGQTPKKERMRATESRIRSLEQVYGLSLARLRGD
jgi:hypothetical protein